jgi:structural maintenance of chromosome 1
MRTRKSGISSARPYFIISLLSFTLTRRVNSISTTGASEYKLNNKTVTYTAYASALTSHNILIKARNFLVFQGDVEAVASQSPQALSRLIDQISGSLELKAEYEKCKEDMEKATERATEKGNCRGD